MTWQEIKSKYEIGSIYNLEVVNIIIQDQQVLFNIEGFDCVLHVSNIANERELSQKLFSVLKKGDIVSVAIINFNDEKQNINLSTKVFRTYLDDVLSFTKSKKIIENELNEHLGLPERYLSMHRNMLDRLRGDLSSNELTFLYELIQNAVDHPNKNFKNVSITFEIFNNYLLVKHNGSLFTENNFKSITGILAGEQINESDRERIGYKGIGFKSIFRYTHNVYVRSGNFSFSFKKEENVAHLPWEVLPIFQLEKDKVDEIQQFDFFNVPVAFAIELISEELKSDVIKYLKQLSQNPYLLIFLENLVSLEIKIPDEIILLEKEIEKQKNFEILTLKSNNNEGEKYLTYSKEYEIINLDVIAELLDENITAIPSKMRNFRKPKVSIALPLIDNSDLINLFTYLPLSNTKHGLPYIINADFIPDLDRTDLVHNLKYNEEVLKFASETLLTFSQILINDNKYSDFLKLIPDFKNSNIRALEIIAENYEENSIILELPNFDNIKIKKDNLIIDKTGIFKIIDEKYINQIEKLLDKHILSSLIIDEEDKLINHLEITTFNEKDLTDLFNLDTFKNDYFLSYKQFIFFLFRIRILENNKKIYKIISEKIKPFLISGIDYFVSDITVFIPELYKDTFNYLELLKPCPPDLENILVNKLNIKSLFDILSIDEYDEIYTVDLIARNIKEIVKKLSQQEDDSVEIKANKRKHIINLWHFLFSNKDAIDSRNNKLVNNQFSDLLIECSNGQLIPLKDSILKKEDNSREDYSFLYERYGDKKMNYVNIDVICNEFKIESKDFNKFIKQISDIEITESRLFNKTLKKISESDFSEIKESTHDDIIKALIAIYKYLNNITDLDLNRNMINKFPILCSNNKIKEAEDVYFDNSYTNYIKGVDFYAQDLFEGVENVYYISTKYIEIIEESKRVDFFNFLIKLNISPGIKILHFNLDRELINQKLKTLKASFFVKDDFYYIHRLGAFSNKYENLKIFWEKLINVENYNLLFKNLISGLSSKITAENLTIRFFNEEELKFFPLENGNCETATEIYSSKLEVYLHNNKNKLCFDISLFNDLEEKLLFRNTLRFEDLIIALNHYEEYDNIAYKNLIIEHFNNIVYSEEENTIIKNLIKFKCFDDEFRKISETIYLDKSLETLSISIISKSNELYKRAIDSIEYNEVFKNKLIELEITVINDHNLTINHIIEENENVIIIEEIQGVFIEYFNDKVISQDISEIEYFFNWYDFVQCSDINISFDNYPTYSEAVLFYNDKKNKKLFFSDELILLDVLCEEFRINNSDKINIRKNLNTKRKNTKSGYQGEDGEKHSKQHDSIIEFSISEIETLKQIIGGELTEELTSQLEANFSASLKGILNLDIIGFSPIKPEDFRKTNVKTFKNDNGEIRNIIFRSSAKGLLYLDPYSWEKLEGGDIELWIYLGKENFRIIYSKVDLINLPYNPYTLIRVDNSEKDIELVNNLMVNAPDSSTKLLFITNQEMAEKLNTDIFNNENNQITKNSNIGNENYL